MVESGPIRINSFESIRNFGYELFSRILETGDINPVISPISAYLALAVAGCGADGTTRDEFYKILGNDMVALASDIMSTFSAQGDLPNLLIANAAWMDNQFAVNSVWTDKIKALMGAEVFRSELASAETMDVINRWIAGKTNGLVEQMLDNPLAGPLALFNTVYFRGAWLNPFNVQKTRREKFYQHNGQAGRKSGLLAGYLNRRHDTVQVDMMHQPMAALDYVSNDFAEGVILPYQKNGDKDECPNLAFVALKSKGTSTVREVGRKLTVKALKALLADRQTDMIDLKLPKFRIAFDRIFNQDLFHMGLTECFDGMKADFAFMESGQNGDTLYIDLVMQKVKIIVDEQGTEAAAATEVIYRCLDSSRKLCFDEPFLYIIMDMDREIPLFIGILDNPAA